MLSDFLMPTHNSSYLSAKESNLMKNLYQNLSFILIVFVVVGSCSQPEEKKAESEEMAEVQEPTSERFGGATLYTVRDHMWRNPDSTLQVISDIGYRYIEEAVGYRDRTFFGWTPEEFKSKLESLDLKPVSTHQGGITLDNADTIIADAVAVGFEYLVIPVPPMGHFRFDPETRRMGMSDSVTFVNDVLNQIGKKCTAAGIKLLYHNHDFEFVANEEEIVPIEYFLENTDPAHVNFQMDLFWVTKAGADPVQYFEKYPGRFKVWHVKDMDAEGNFAPVGRGTINFGKLLAQKELSGMEYYIVEQDQTYELDPLEAIKISHKGLSKFGFE
jgi:sugar phosphate isomerase/epimerase